MCLRKIVQCIQGRLEISFMEEMTDRCKTTNIASCTCMCLNCKHGTLAVQFVMNINQIHVYKFTLHEQVIIYVDEMIKHTKVLFPFANQRSVDWNKNTQLIISNNVNTFVYA